jgi:very-short-patch-repair endonuclease
MAAMLACGEGAALSHNSAASIWGIRTPRPGPVDVTLPSRSNRSRSGIRLHRARALDPSDLRHHDGLLLTAPARTLIDLAQAISHRDLDRAYEQALVLGIMRSAELQTTLERSPGRRGAPAIRALLNLDRRSALTRSEAEMRLLSLLRDAELTPTDVNVRVGRHEVDFLWRPERLVVEVDGFTYHASRAAFERDRLRDANLQAAGYRVVRITWRQLQERPAAVVARLAQALARA